MFSPLPRTGCEVWLHKWGGGADYGRDWAPDLEAAMARSGVSASLTTLLEIIRHESQGDRYAQSEACARGLFQIMPANWDAYLEVRGLSAAEASIWDPEHNMAAALWLLDAIGEWRGWRCWWGRVGERPFDLGHPRCSQQAV